MVSMDRTWVSDILLDVYFLIQVFIQHLKLKVFSGLSFYC